MAKKGLGKGLGSFFENDEIPAITEEITTKVQPTQEIALSKIEPNKNQPRHTFDKEKLQALADSIKEQGLIQPLIVTKQQNDRYMIVAGERRWRAAKLAGLKKVSVVIKEYTDAQIAQIALIENLQREDLNPIEEALGYRSLLEEYSLTQDALSRISGKSRSAIANAIRLLSLEEGLQKLVISGELSGGHARALLSLEGKKEREAIAKRIIDEDLSVRQTENICAAAKKTKKQGKAPKKEDSAYKIEIERIQETLCSGFGTKVKIVSSKNKGKIEIEYYGNDDLERILGMFNI